MNRIRERWLSGPARPTLEQLEDRFVPSIDYPNLPLVVAQFGSSGVWEWIGNTWAQITASKATVVAASSQYFHQYDQFASYSSIIVCEFPGWGVWSFHEATNSWTHLTWADASLLAVSPQYGSVAAEIPGQGVWEYNFNGTGQWTQLTAANASLLAMNSSGSQTVAAEFPGGGVWTFEGGWHQLTAADASSLSIAQDRTVLAEFPGQGVWYHNPNTGWANHHITSNDAAIVSLSENVDEAAAYFPQANGAISSPGLWVNPLNGQGWQYLFTAAECTLMGIAGRGSYTVAEFPTYGVWMFYNNHWIQLTGADASVLAVDTGIQI